MTDHHLKRLRPTMRMIAQHFDDIGWHCQVHIQKKETQFRSVLVYNGQPELLPDVVYLLDGTETQLPPPGTACISTVGQPGFTNYIYCPGISRPVILNHVLELFAQCREWEYRIDQAVYNNVSLPELCELGAELLGNPVGIHDDWFVISAMSGEFERVIEPEYVLSSSKGFMPRSIVDDFQNDSDYLETYAHKTAQIWQPGNGAPRSLYVNLWDGTVYLGRMLVIEINRDFRAADFQLAEILTQRAMRLMYQQKLGEPGNAQGMDTIMMELLSGKAQDSADLTRVLNTLHWDRSDRYLCVQITGQQTLTAVLEHALHSDMFRVFPGSYILLSNGQQIMVINLTKSRTAYGDISYLLAPLCRDYYLYAGVSSPVSGIRDLVYAYRQAELAVEHAFAVKSERWIVHFSDCALKHIMEKIQSPVPSRLLAAPCLQSLIDHDREKDTQYFETLRTYMRLERDIPRTAEALIIHRTTLLYRLRKIKALMGMDLENEEVRLYLLLSLYLMEHNNTRK